MQKMSQNLFRNIGSSLIITLLASTSISSKIEENALTFKNLTKNSMAIIPMSNHIKHPNFQDELLYKAGTPLAQEVLVGANLSLIPEDSHLGLIVIVGSKLPLCYFIPLETCKPSECHKFTTQTIPGKTRWGASKTGLQLTLTHESGERFSYMPIEHFSATYT